ncbi:MAG: 2Fe-2S iron-sulfur cluster-binding protein [Thermoplasmatota archaeon]
MASFTFDGKTIPIHEGDTFASALHRAGILELSRSMKYHRPRGSHCFTGGCAGCLVQVDDRPNITACLEKAVPATVQSQNRIGSAKRDLLGVTDMVYRKGFDPHGAFTKPRLLNMAFLKAVRFMSGVGKAPEEPIPVTAKRYEIEVDEIIIGAGRAGHARAAASAGDVLLVDEGDIERTPDGVTAWSHALAFGIYAGVVAVRRGHDLWEVRAKRITLTTGSHDGWPLFAGNDLPGVIGLRGAMQLLEEHDVLPGHQVVVHGTPDEAFCDALEQAGGTLVAAGDVTEVSGGTRVEKARIKGTWHRCDAVVCDVPRNPRLELLQQAGCALEARGGVLKPKVDRQGQTTVAGVYWREAP